MNKESFIGLLIGGVLVIILGMAYLLRPSAEASEVIEALPLEETQIEEVSLMEDLPGEEMTEDFAEDNLLIFVIDQSRSEVRFSLDEILRGSPFNPVGITNQVAGEIGIEFSDPSASQLGTILINARTFQTDSSNRDRAIKNQILDTNEFEFIRFEPKIITGFPDEIVIGEEVVLEVVGDLTVRDITKSVTFIVNVTVISESEIQGYASAVVIRSEFDLKIPSVTGVAEVSDEVLLEIEFFAVNN